MTDDDSKDFHAHDFMFFRDNVPTSDPVFFSIHVCIDSWSASSTVHCDARNLHLRKAFMQRD